tara:strand:- start:576 stop:794 length:219 start_codon:yes stop_codon:yes gene_type:complete
MTAPWLIRVASHPRHGGGHLARCTVLAEALRETGAARKRLISDFIAAPTANSGVGAADAIISFLAGGGSRHD